MSHFNLPESSRGSSNAPGWPATTATLEPTVGPDEAEKRRKAAAARRHRSKALARGRKKARLQKQLHHPSPRSVSQPRVFQGPPLTGLSRDEEEENGKVSSASSRTSNNKSLEGDEEVNSTSSGSSSDGNVTNTTASGSVVYSTCLRKEPSSPVSSTSPCANSTTKRFEATVDGLVQVLTSWQQNKIVAIPTECTYEACTTLQATEPTQDIATAAQDWAYRIKQLRQASRSSSSNATTSTSLYCYVPRSASSPWLYDCFPPRKFAIRSSSLNNSSTTTADKPPKPTGMPKVHVFNESQEVLQRISRHVWPGPVTIHVAVPSPNGTPSAGASRYYPFWSQLTTRTHPPSRSLSSTLSEGEADSSAPSSAVPCPYLTLRCPRHPLAMKAAQQHHATQHAQRRGSASKPEPLQQQDNGQPTTPPPNQTKPFSILVGFPIVRSQQQQQQSCPATPNDSNNENNESSFCCTSIQVQRQQEESSKRLSTKQSRSKISAVLDGENQRELFAVPTCEYGEPWQTQIWIHGPSRTITVVQPRSSLSFAATISPSPPPETGNPTVTTPSGSSSNNLSVSAASPWSPAASVGQLATSLESRIKGALRQRAPQTPRGGPGISKAKERVVQATLSKWKIEMIEPRGGCQSQD
eukprot:CAMPEP_0172439536 /NCGR_PEP_ID=MMETSP1065-20121228/490_1 /TAXON_ID=265537 /ORGANISM="Amphiprora paludosa, Strain CCMP125" /LENGTH=638 /DNA_ID=CAMNT_0013188231 /DNA_START=327 /DNA_END=2243 /DNA_ORIENTATION=+